MKQRNPQLDHFDGIVVGRLFAPDFAQPKHEFDFYREKSIDQIKCAISNISNAHTQLDLISTFAQANAFIDSAYNLEFINLSEKSIWIAKARTAHTKQLIGA